MHTKAIRRDIGYPVYTQGCRAPGYQLPYDPRKVDNNAVYLLRGSKWKRISGARQSPQYLYERTSLAFDTKRDQLILHGGGPRTPRALDIRRQDAQMGESPAVRRGDSCMRETIYLPGPDVFLTYGSSLCGE